MHLKGLFCILGILVLLSACQRNEGDRPNINENSVQVRMGLGGGIQDESSWSILEIRATNTGGDFDGAVEIQGGYLGMDQFEPGLVTYRVETEIPAGSTRKITIPVRPVNWTALSVKFKQGGYFKRIVTDLSISPVMFRALVITERPRNYSAFTRWLKTTYLEPLYRQIHMVPERKN